MKTTRMQDIKPNTLFICPGVGVLRKTHPCQGTDKKGQTRVIYPMDEVQLLKRKGEKA